MLAWRNRASCPPRVSRLVPDITVHFAARTAPLHDEWRAWIRGHLAAAA